MTPKQKKYIIENLKWPINFDYLFKYIILAIPATLIFIGITPYETDDFSINLIIIGIITIMILAYRIKSGRRFKIFLLPAGLSTNELAVKLKTLNWRVYQNDNVLEISTAISPFSWGNKITIVKVTTDKILINTQPVGKAPVTLFMDILNYKKIQNLLKS